MPIYPNQNGVNVLNPIKNYYHQNTNENFPNASLHVRNTNGNININKQGQEIDATLDTGLKLIAMRRENRSKKMDKQNESVHDHGNIINENLQEKIQKIQKTQSKIDCERQKVQIHKMKRAREESCDVLSNHQKMLRKHRRQPRLLTSPLFDSPRSYHSGFIPNRQAHTRTNTSSYARISKNGNIEINVNNHSDSNSNAIASNNINRSNGTKLSQIPLMHQCVHCGKPNILQNDIKYVISKCVQQSVNQSIMHNFNQLVQKGNNKINNINLNSHSYKCNHQEVDKKNKMKYSLGVQAGVPAINEFEANKKQNGQLRKRVILEAEITSCIYFPSMHKSVNEPEETTRNHKNENENEKNQRHKNGTCNDENNNGNQYVKVPTSMMNLFNMMMANFSSQMFSQQPDDHIKRQMQIETAENNSPIGNVNYVKELKEISQSDMIFGSQKQDLSVTKLNDNVSDVSTLHWSEDDQD